MAKHTIETPVEGFNGLVAGVRFVDGKGSTDDEGAIAYFERQGYKVAGDVKELLAYAKDRSISIAADVKTKEDILNAIKPGGTPYKGVTTPEGEALVSDSTDPEDHTVKNQDELPENAK
jgi:hypothetical protein